MQYLIERTDFQPFILHKMGFTTFVNTVIELMQEENSFSAIERIVNRKRQMYITSIAVLAKKFQKEPETATFYPLNQFNFWAVLALQMIFTINI